MCSRIHHIACQVSGTQRQFMVKIYLSGVTQLISLLTKHIASHISAYKQRTPLIISFAMSSINSEAASQRISDIDSDLEGAVDDDGKDKKANRDKNLPDARTSSRKENH